MSAYERLLQGWGCRKSVASADMVLVPRAVLEELVLLAFGRTVFSEAEYLQTYPDVEQAVRNKAFISGLQHFLWEGIKENRSVTAAQVDPRRYRELNPDLAEVSSLKSDAALVEHWLSVGWLEGRLHK